MNCPHCSRLNLETSNFCIRCGKPLRPIPPPVDPDFITAEISSLRNAVDALTTAIEAHGIEIPELEPVQHVTTPERVAYLDKPVEQSEDTDDSSAEFEDARLEPEISYSDGEEFDGDEPSDRSQTTDISLSDRPGDFDWDRIIGGNWLARVGALAVVLGIGFFLKLSFDNNWIGETGRVALGIGAGIVLLGAGEYWRAKYPVYAQALFGAGIAILYLAIFAAFALYDLIGMYPATGLLVLVSVTSAILAVTHNSMALALMGIVGGFGAPFVLGAGGGSGTSSIPPTSEAVTLLGYIATINIGVILLSTFRKWYWFVLLSLAGSLATFGIWYDQYMGFGGIELNTGRTSALLIAEAGLTSIFLSFVAATTLFHLVWRRRPNELDLTLMFSNASIYALISYGIMWTEFREWMGAFTLLMALFYVGLGYVALVRIGIAPIDRSKPDYDVLLTYIPLGISAVFLTIAVPVQVGAPWVSVAWVVEAIVIIWIGTANRLPDIRRAAVVLYALSLGWVVVIDTPLAIEAGPGFFHNRFVFSYAFLAIGAFGTAYMAARWKEQFSASERFLAPAAIVAGFGILVLAVPSQVEGSWMVFTWTVLGLVATLFGARIGLVEMRLTGLGVLLITAAAAMISESTVSSRGYTVLINSRFLAFGPLIVAVGVAAVVWARWPQREVRELRRPIVMASILLANWLALWFLSAEVIGGIQSGTLFDVSSSDRSDVVSLGLTALWGIYGAAALVIGIFGGWRPVRLGGLGLLAVPVAKLFLVDSFQLEAEFRVAAFMIMGLILLSGGYLYQRHGEAFKDFFMDSKGAESNV